MDDKQSLIGICKHDRRRSDGTGDVQWGIKLQMGGKTVETFYFVDRDDRDRAWSIIHFDPTPWFRKHFSSDDPVIGVVPLPEELTNCIKDDSAHLVKTGNDYRPITSEERNSGKFQLCISCTTKERKFIYHDVTLDPVELAMKGHFMQTMKDEYEKGMEWDEIDQLTPEILDLMAEYASRVIREIGVVKGAEFVQLVMQEVAQGKRVPIKEEERIPSFVALSIQTDESGYPMLIDEIRDWIEVLRLKHNFPTEVRSITHGGSKMEDQVTMEEMLCFCLYVESRQVGAGRHIFGGKVVL